MPQFVSQDLFDRVAYALVINTDPVAAEKRSAEEVADFLKDARSAFPEDDFSRELFDAARWLKEWARTNFGAEGNVAFDVIRLMNERCQAFYPSGGRRPVHASDTQPLAPRTGERMQRFMENTRSYAAQLS